MLGSFVSVDIFNPISGLLDRSSRVVTQQSRDASSVTLEATKENGKHTNTLIKFRTSKWRCRKKLLFNVKLVDSRSKVTLVVRELVLSNGIFHRQSLSWYQYQSPCQLIEPGRSCWIGQRISVHRPVAHHRKLLHISCCDLCAIQRLWYSYGPISHFEESMAELSRLRKDPLAYILLEEYIIGT